MSSSQLCTLTALSIYENGSLVLHQIDFKLAVLILKGGLSYRFECKNISRCPLINGTKCRLVPNYAHFFILLLKIRHKLATADYTLLFRSICCTTSDNATLMSY